MTEYQGKDDRTTGLLVLVLLAVLIAGVFSQAEAAAEKDLETVWFTWTTPLEGADVLKYETFAQTWFIGETDTTYSFRHISPDTTAPVVYATGKGMRVRVRGIGEYNGEEVEGPFSLWSASYFGAGNTLPGNPGQPVFSRTVPGIKGWR